MPTRYSGLFAAALILTSTAPSSAAGAPDVTPPPGAAIVREVQAGGVQVYTCRAGTSGTYHWILSGPKALLINQDGSDFGTHSNGPTWAAVDGSSISADGAHPLEKVDRPDSVPALLLSVTSSRGSGALNGVRLVRRSDTEGGMPPSKGCDAAHENEHIASHYSAVYTFYR
jgi:hypothetical protein